VDHSRPEFGNRPPSPLFRDVPVGHWAMEFIAPLVKQGVFKGYVDATFRPNQAITRAEAAKVIYLTLRATNAFSV
jgi:hemolysin-activating ACP:hemolysin acyltransferase